MIGALLLGAGYGLVAGITPGPTLALVLTATLERGRRAGRLVAVAPLVTDAPIVLAAVLVLDRLPDAALGSVGLLGSAVVVALAIRIARSAGTVDLLAEAREMEPARRALWQGVAVNALSPHPYVFWFAVGGPLVVRIADTSGAVAGALFLTGFFALIVGCKLAVADAVERARRFLTGQRYRRTLLAASALLGALGVVLAVESVQLLSSALGSG